MLPRHRRFLAICTVLIVVGFASFLILKSFQDKTSFVYDLRRKEFYKGGSSGIDIYRTLATGLDGSPMNAYDYISDFERWNLVHFLQSLHGIKRDKTLSVINEITSKRIDSPITPAPITMESKLRVIFS